MGRLVQIMHNALSVPAVAVELFSSNELTVTICYWYLYLSLDDKPISEHVNTLEHSTTFHAHVQALKKLKAHIGNNCIRQEWVNSQDSHFVYR